MAIRRVSPTGLFPGVPYAYATVAGPASALVWLAGACPIDEEGVVPSADLHEQAVLAVANLRRVLADLGADLSAVVRTTVYVATSDHAELVAGWEAVRAAFAGVDPPSTLVGVALLGYTGQRIEVEAVACLPDGATTEQWNSPRSSASGG